MIPESNSEFYDTQVLLSYTCNCSSFYSCAFSLSFTYTPWLDLPFLPSLSEETAKVSYYFPEILVPAASFKVKPTGRGELAILYDTWKKLTEVDGSQG